MDNYNKLSEELLKIDGIDPENIPDSERKMFRQLLDKHLNSGKSKQVLWRIIMNNKITKYAAAAVIIIALLMGIHNSGGSIDIASLALGQTVENMQEMPWILITDGPEGKVDMQVWINFESGVYAFNFLQTQLGYNNKKEGIEYTYYPSQQDVIYFSKIYEEIHHFFPYFNNLHHLPAENVFELTKYYIEDFEESNPKVKRKVVKQNGEKVEVITSKTTSGGFLGLFEKKTEIRRSIDRNLILSMKTDGYPRTFSYPTEGPESIYDIGAPKDAEIRDFTIPADIADLIIKLNTIRQTTLTNYVALSLPAEIEQLPTSIMDTQPVRYFTVKDNLASLIWRRGEDKCHSMGYFSYQNDVPTIETLSENIQSAADSFIAVSSDIYETYEQRNFGSGSDIFIELINWPYIISRSNRPCEWKMESVIGEDNRTLIKIESTYLLSGRSTAGLVRWFIDPARDYICTKYESGPRDEEPIRIIEILEYGQTQSGQWYPRLIQKTYKRSSSRVAQQEQCSRIIYLQENPDFPDGIFDPNSFPEAED